MGYTIQGFKASAVAAGLKKGGALDLALLYSEKEATAAGVFTTNLVKAAPVLLSREHIRDGKARAIVANAGNANACTGPQGMRDAQKTAELVSRRLGIHPEEVLVASTGVIGEPLDMNLITNAVVPLVESLQSSGLEDAAKAIMTTDSFPKTARFAGAAGGRPYEIVGMAKGAGMIMPNMATMLSFILTDISIDAHLLQNALQEGVEKTFNRTSVDGDTSTNDTVFALANGVAGNGPLSQEDRMEFARGLTRVMDDLARMIARDGEGATKFVTLELRGAASADDALQGARTVANSALVKTALYGRDPNWGRIMAALGRAGISMEESAMDIWIDDVQIVKGGLGCGKEAEEMAAKRMENDAFVIIIDMHVGIFAEKIYTCDLSHEYVSINADYRT
ncbi:MAG: bifunctional glutamate N-acetyltransferase/amino-acid acetyltransferase ArgJ [Deltaproteobacteria bacterium]|nr:bifunctional glutamate N-acetyltransferase/amino-acid acetyltransferase ArgJ [Deltaproteobacteria bacterium]